MFAFFYQYTQRDITLITLKLTQYLLNSFSVDYSAIRREIRDGLRILKREGRSLRPRKMSKLLGNIGALLDFEKIVQEIETSLMSIASCEACKVGKKFEYYGKILLI